MEKRIVFKKLSGNQLIAAGATLLLLLVLPLKVTLSIAAVAMMIAGLRENHG